MLEETGTTCRDTCSGSADPQNVLLCRGRFPPACESIEMPGSEPPSLEICSGCFIAWLPDQSALSQGQGTAKWVPKAIVLQFRAGSKRAFVRSEAGVPQENCSCCLHGCKFSVFIHIHSGHRWAGKDDDFQMEDFLKSKLGLIWT